MPYLLLCVKPSKNAPPTDGGDPSTGGSAAATPPPAYAAGATGVGAIAAAGLPAGAVAGGDAASPASVASATTAPGSAAGAGAGLAAEAGSAADAASVQAGGGATPPLAPAQIAPPAVEEQQQAAAAHAEALACAMAAASWRVHSALDVVQACQAEAGRALLASAAVQPSVAAGRPGVAGPPTHTRPAHLKHEDGLRDVLGSNGAGRQWCGGPQASLMGAKSEASQEGGGGNGAGLEGGQNKADPVGSGSGQQARRQGVPLSSSSSGGGNCRDHKYNAWNIAREEPAVHGVLLLPVQSMIMGAFPLNGTYFQVGRALDFNTA